MIVLKCTREDCTFSLSYEQLSQNKKGYLKCPLCKAKTKKNITNSIDRKKWYCYLSKDTSLIEHAILVIIDSFSDDSHEVEIPLLNLKFAHHDKLLAIYKAANKIEELLKIQYKATYENNQQFITTAFQNENAPVKHNIPTEKMIFQTNALNKVN